MPGGAAARGQRPEPRYHETQLPARRSAEAAIYSPDSGVSFLHGTASHSPGDGKGDPQGGQAGLGQRVGRGTQGWIHSAPRPPSASYPQSKGKGEPRKGQTLPVTTSPCRRHLRATCPERAWRTPTCLGFPIRKQGKDQFWPLWDVTERP